MKTRYLLSVALLGLLAGSCTDLDVDVKSYYTEYPNSEIALEAKTADAYFAFRGALGRRFDEGNSMNSDEYTGVSFDGDYYNNGDCANFSLHTINYDNCKNMLNVYNDIMSGITRCNPLIIEFGGDDAAASAPLRAVRAFYHFLLMDHWGDTPILDHPLEEGEAVDRSPRAEVAKWIEQELLAVRDKCPEAVSASTYGKPTRWMVDALLAKLYINWPVYTKDVTSASWAYGENEKLNDCIAACDRLIQSGHFALAGGDENPNRGGKSDFKKKFFYDNGPQIKDFIYAMPFDAITQTGLTYARFRTWRRGQNGNGLYSVEMTKSVGGNFALTPEFAALFNLPGDRRNDCIVGDGNAETFDVYQYDANTGEKTSVRNTYKDEAVTFTRSITLKEGAESAELNCGADMKGWCQGYRSIKFFPNITQYNEYDRNQSNDVPIFRFADVLLMKAEAIVRGGSATNGDTPQSLFNQIRSYAGAPTLSATPTLQDILDERGREFLDEHWRRNDLIRFGDFERPWGFKTQYGSNDPKMRLWPLSIDVLNNNTNWKQNPGY
ncbi:MAG: RagB/SusD family nutrient uptake outer membrane protein [Bacteroidaceae bacterium]|nr:RagB/SusD family nutrient uptake outer membrane protein [Bacteroidaceae bacterium]